MSLYTTESPLRLRANWAIIFDRTLTSFNALTIPLEMFRAKFWSLDECISHTIGGCISPLQTAIIDIIDFKTNASANFNSFLGCQLAAPFIIMIDFALCAFTFFKLFIFVTVPDLVMIRVVNVSTILSRIILSISSLSFSAKITIEASGSDSLASTNSRIISRILSPNPKIKV